MAGLEPARAFYGPTDFKSVASTIPPHRHVALYERKVGLFASQQSPLCYTVCYTLKH
jgi:hypothetical protein